MQKKKKSMMLALAALLALTVTAGCGQVKVGFINGERVIEEAPQLKSIMDEGNEKLMAAEKEAQEALKNTEGKSQEEMQKASQDAQRKLMGLNQQYASRMQQTLEGALAEIAQAKKLDVVVDNIAEQETVIEGGIDLTDEVIAKLQ